MNLPQINRTDHREIQTTPAVSLATVEQIKSRLEGLKEKMIGSSLGRVLSQSFPLIRSNPDT
jgi:hypothetical protein